MVKIFIGNVPDSASNSELRDMFAKYGKVTEADIVDGKGFGFVHMETQDEADAAVAGLNGTEMQGRNINVELSTGRSKRSTGGRDRGSGRGGGRGMGRGGGRDYYYDGAGRGGGPPRDYPRPPPRYDGYQTGGYQGRYAEPYYDRNGPAGYYGRESGAYAAPTRDHRAYDRRMPTGAGDPYARGGYDAYDRRPQAPMYDHYGRPEPYARAPDPYARDPYYSRERRPPSPRGPGGGYYDRRTPPHAGGYSGYMARSPPSGGGAR